MQINTKEILSKYSSNLSDVTNILKYLHTYPELLAKIKVEELINPDSIKDYLDIWLKLYSNFDNKIDKEFFKPYWLPIETDSYGIFIDFSNKNYPIFETKYFFYEPYQWYKNYIVKNASELLLCSDKNSLEITEIMESHNTVRRNMIFGLFNKN